MQSNSTKRREYIEKPIHAPGSSSIAAGDPLMVISSGGSAVDNSTNYTFKFAPYTMQSVSGSIHAEMVAVSGNIHAEMVAVSGNLHSELAGISGFIQSELLGISGFIQSELSAISGNLHGEVMYVSGAAGAHIATVTGNPHGVTLGQAATAQGAVAWTTTGVITAPGFTVSSLRELKTAFGDLPDAEEVLRKMEPVEFEYKSQPGVKHYGFVYEDSPQEVRGINGMDLSHIVAFLVSVVKSKLLEK
jgi:hypothetical protein